MLSHQVILLGFGCVVLWTNQNHGTLKCLEIFVHLCCQTSQSYNWNHPKSKPFHCMWPEYQGVSKLLLKQWKGRTCAINQSDDWLGAWAYSRTQMLKLAVEFNFNSILRKIELKAIATLLWLVSRMFTDLGSLGLLSREPQDLGSAAYLCWLSSGHAMFLP